MSESSSSEQSGGEQFADRAAVMRRAIELAERGVGRVEPNPPVGAVVVDAQLRKIAEGYHQQFGEPHAEIHALNSAGPRARGATLFVTLEPCCHHGKTPPCTAAILNAGIQKVVVGIEDPAPHVAGQGLERLRSAGCEVEVGVLASEVRRLTAPFLKSVQTGLPYVHAKWAMTLDGKIASRTGHSQWISNIESRAIVHRLRGRMDAVMVGIGTALADDPLLTARPPGPRTAVRIVVDSQASLPVESQLVRTIDQGPVWVVVGQSAPQERLDRLQAAGVEVISVPSNRKSHPTQTAPSPSVDRPHLPSLLKELGRRQFTNILVEGGGTLLGNFFDEKLIDEIHVFIAPKIVGGLSALSPVGGQGRLTIAEAFEAENPQIEVVGHDVYIHGPLATSAQ